MGERLGTGQNGPFYTPHDSDDDRLDGGAGEERGDPFLDSTRPPNDEERRRLRQLFNRLGSKEKVYRAAWGFKNGKTLAWLNEALEEEVDEDEDDGEPVFEKDSALDLSTPQGRAVFEEWKKAGLVKLGIDPTE